MIYCHNGTLSVTQLKKIILVLYNITRCYLYVAPHGTGPTRGSQPLYGPGKPVLGFNADGQYHDSQHFL